MTREEIVAGLRGVVEFLDDHPELMDPRYAEAVERALRLLQLPQKVASARRWLEGSLSSDRCPDIYYRVLKSGLDALDAMLADDAVPTALPTDPTVPAVKR